MKEINFLACFFSLLFFFLGILAQTFGLRSRNLCGRHCSDQAFHKNGLRRKYGFGLQLTLNIRVTM